MTNQVIPAEAVEAAARAAYIHHFDEPTFDAEAAWNDMEGTEDWEREQWESIARAALDAASPRMQAAWEEARKGEAFEELRAVAEEMESTK